MGAQCTTARDRNTEQRLLAEMAFIGTLMIGFLVVWCPLMSGGGAADAGPLRSVEGSTCADIVGEEPIDDDWDGVDAGPDRSLATRSGFRVDVDPSAPIAVHPREEP